MINPTPKRRHHHVWQYYLATRCTCGSLWCLQNDRVFQTGTSVVAVERDFYRLQELTQADIELITSLLTNGHPISKRNQSGLINGLMLPFKIAEQFGKQQTNQFVNAYASTVLEDYHTSIENSFITLLQNALNGDIGFYNNDEQCITFLNYLCTQYLRPKAIESEQCRYAMITNASILGACGTS
jgi:hypothetical protein